uniref:Uncharacterized protein n=1 Tax=Anguilla anguilla TaxID=7936 RepID=A0A0E9PY02_ANGAN
MMFVYCKDLVVDHIHAMKLFLFKAFYLCALSEFLLNPYNSPICIHAFEYSFNRAPSGLGANGWSSVCSRKMVLL